MSQLNKVQLRSSCILTVPLQNYGDSFSFIVNGEKFKTSKLISDLLSPKISKIHLNDPLVSSYTINTQHRGNFSHILELFNFKPKLFAESEVPFLFEVLEKLENNSIEYQEFNEYTEITKDNVFTFIKKHEKYNIFYANRFLTEIDFVSSHFYELCESHVKEFMTISVDTLKRILLNNKLRLNNEDQLLNFINKLHSKNSMYSILYETVLYENVSAEIMSEFISIYDNNDMNRETWIRLSKRLVEETKTKNDTKMNKNERYKGNVNENERYKGNVNEMTFSKSENKDEFNGILKYLLNKSNNQIEKEIKITASSVSGNCIPQNVVLFEEEN